MAHDRVDYTLFSEKKVSYMTFCFDLLRAFLKNLHQNLAPKTKRPQTKKFWNTSGYLLDQPSQINCNEIEGKNKSCLISYANC